MPRNDGSARFVLISCGLSKVMSVILGFAKLLADGINAAPKGGRRRHRSCRAVLTIRAHVMHPQPHRCPA